MIRLTSTIALASILAACATSTELRSGRPDTAVVSSKPASAVAACVLDRWEAVRTLGSGALVSVRPLAGGTTVYADQGNGTPLYFVDVRDIASGSSSAFYSNGMTTLEGRARDAVRACQ